MLILGNTSSTLAVVTGSAGAISVHATYADNAPGSTTVTPYGTNTASITSATTTTVVASPSGSNVRNVQSLIIHNTSASVANLVTVQHYDGTNTANIFSATLQAGEMAVWCFGKGWTVYDANGAEKTTFSVAQQTVITLSSGTTLTTTTPNCYVRVTSATSGAKTVTLLAATGSGYVTTVTDAGALAANPGNNITVASASSINGPAVLNIATMSLSFKDVAAGQWDSI